MTQTTQTATLPPFTLVDRSQLEAEWLVADSLNARSDTSTVTVVPDNDTDIFFERYDPSVSSSGFVDGSGPGGTESQSYTLSSPGLYAIRIGEFDYGAGSYQIQLSQN